jgi:transposase
MSHSERSQRQYERYSGDYLTSMAYDSAAAPSEVNLAKATVQTIRVGRQHQAGRPRQKPERLIADRGYISDSLRKQLAERGIELIGPQSSATQRRWRVERTIVWVGNFRRLLVRYERLLKSYRAFFHIACFMITLRRVSK